MQTQLAELNAHMQAQQEHMQQLTEWRGETDGKLTACDATLQMHATFHTVDAKLHAYTIALEPQAKVHTAVQTQVGNLVDSLEKTKAQSKAHPGKLATARLRRHALTLRANSRVRKKRIVQHRMTPL
jgi:hypothetical protein